MYDYRKMTPQQRAEIVEYRRRHKRPLHSPPHWNLGISDQYILTATCYEHMRIIGKHPERMTQCEEEVLSTCGKFCSETYSWCILPNHYHVLIKTDQLKELTGALGKFHGRSSFAWNGEDGCRGRKVWHRCFDRAIRSERHFWATVNYIHHNPIYHGYVDRWQDWIWSSASDFLEMVGRDECERIWKEYPILGYGKKWDVQ
jgi:REP-associated tyrosine transposase